MNDVNISVLINIFRLSFIDAKLKKEPVTTTSIACVSVTSNKGTNVQSARGYWERFEICNSTTWFLSFYVLNSYAYISLKRKCPTGTYVQPVNTAKEGTYKTIRTDVANSFEPAVLNLYYKRENVYRITIDKNWMLKDLYQLCNASVSISSISFFV